MSINNPVSNGMKIDGKAISSKILSELKEKVVKLKEKGINPTMAVILIGNDEASAVYIKQKEIKAKEIGARVKLFKFGNTVTNVRIKNVIRKLVIDPEIHGIILQRPAPPNIKVEKLTEMIPGTKEVDGFGSLSKYPAPVAQAVIVMLENVFEQTDEGQSFTNWLKSKKIVVVGKGETAGKPIVNHLMKFGGLPLAVDSHTPSKNELIKNADIVISAVGKSIINKLTIKKTVILIGVGLYTDSEGKLMGDYDDEEVKSIASYYSPTPGGVGPVNVACLMENLVKAAELSNP